MKIAFKILLGMFAITALGACGTISADDVAVGDCYEQPPENEEVYSLKEQDCALPHDIEKIGEYKTAETQAEINTIGADESENFTKGQLDCFDKFGDNTILLDEGADLPEDWRVSYGFIPGDDDQNQVDCEVLSPSGQLTGSVLKAGAAE